MSCQPSSSTAQHAFSQWSVSELRISATHRNLGEPATEEDIAHVIREVDLDGSGQIDYQEFSKAVMGEMKDAGFSL